MNNMVDILDDIFGGNGTPEVVELIINVRLGTELLYDTKMSMDLHEYVYNLKYKMHEMDDGLVIDLMTAVYCGQIMEDHNFLKTYNLFNGATVHLFKQIKPEKIVVPKTVSEMDLVKLLTAIYSIPYNQTFKTALLNLKKTEELDKLTATIPGLNEDPVSITLLRHPELLKQYDRETVKSLVDSHPTLAIAILKIVSNINEENLQAFSDATRFLYIRSYDEAIQDLLRRPSLPLSGSSSRLATRNLPFRVINNGQLASATSRITDQLQPSTSTATNTGNISVPSTSTGIVSNANTRNISQQLGNSSLPSQLQTMRDMGLTNDTLNWEALRSTGDLRLAIDLVLSGFSTPDIV